MKAVNSAGVLPTISTLSFANPSCHLGVGESLESGVGSLATTQGRCPQIPPSGLSADCVAQRFRLPFY
jgi:hypothetical protein